MFQDALDSQFSESKTECESRCCVFYNINRILRLCLDAVCFSLLTVVCTRANTLEFGHYVFYPIFLYTLGTLIAVILMVPISIFQGFFNIKPALQLCAVLVQVLGIYFIFRAILFTTDDYIKELQEYSFSNWAVDMEYMTFQSNHGCEGLSLANGTCEMCCDNDYIKEIQNKVDEFFVYLLVCLIFILYNFLTLTLPSCLCQTFWA